ncbi:hypothetical protein I3843_16G097800 [Carya illinoinensis]|uniref:Uncharacterized protein n=1 Tax=Carya illinoinensis TaxID=32201 RepID=A0A8T1N8F6_CARIL|nr:hypothetical protein I3760_16G100000 [Carya illinoinensis]KAG6625460.1 hypothetical protein CIPAW_16G098600 [Carya illinoinensis]KAG6673109.1 hypothetical protein I3842_16G095400 [Carya illinoinensis]KAG7942335.1 hypothetical protein I3843_16G097800 [Carya illinoinensis]
MLSILLLPVPYQFLLLPSKSYQFCGLIYRCVKVTHVLPPSNRPSVLDGFLFQLSSPFC